MRRLPAGFAVAVGLALILPLLNYFRVPPMGDFFGEWGSAVAMSVALLFLMPQLRRRSRVNGVLLLPPVLLALLVGAQLLLARYAFPQDWVLWLAYLWMFLLAIVAGQHFREVGQEVEVARRLCWAVILVAGINVAAQAAQLTKLDVVLQPFIIAVSNGAKCTIFGNTGQSNQTALIAWLGIAAALHLLGTGRLRTSLAVTLTSCLLISAALTNSRMAWLFCFFLSAIVYFSQSWPMASATSRRTWAAALPFGFAAASLVGAAFVSVLDLPCASAAGRLLDSNDGGIPIRLALWRQSVAVWLSTPWFGVGAANFFGASYRLQPLGMHEPLDGYVHNSLLQILAEFGLFGLAAVTLPGAVLAMNVVRRWSRLTAVEILMLSWIGLLGIQSMLEFPLWYVHFLMLFGLAIGLLFRSDTLGLTLQLPVRAIVGFMASAALIGCMFLFYDYRKLDRVTYLVQLQLQMSATSPKIDATIKAAGEDVRFYRLIAEHALALREPINRDHLQEKIAVAQRILRRAPVPENIVRVILFESLAGNRSGVQENLARLVMFFPPTEGGAVSRLRQYVAERPNEFGDLVQQIDDAIAHAPPRRWR